MDFKSLFEEGKDVVWLLEVIIEFLKLGGVAAVMSVLVNLGKSVGIVKEGKVDYWVAGMQVIGVGVAAYFGFTKPDLVAEWLKVADEEAQKIATVIGYILSVIVAIKQSGFEYKNFLRGLPVVGKSFSIPNK